MKIERIAKPRSKNTISEHPLKLTRHLRRNCEKSEMPIITFSFGIIGNGIGKLKPFYSHRKGFEH